MIDLSLSRRTKLVLDTLLDMPMWDTFRALDMQIFYFGRRHPDVNRHGQPIERADVTLHIQCAWRILCDGNIVVASRDRAFDPVRSSQLIIEAQGEGYCLLDEHMIRLFGNFSGSYPRVEEVDTDNLGGFRLKMSSGFELEVWSNNSLEADCELWRLCTEHKHFVMRSTGLESV